MAMIIAAQEELPVLSLAAVRLFGEKPPLGHQLSTAELYPGFGFANSNTTTGLPVCLYDFGARSRSWNRYAYVLGNPLALTDPDGQDPNCGPDRSWDGEGCSGGGTAGQGSASANTNPEDPCAYVSSTGDASCAGPAPGLWNNGMPIYGPGGWTGVGGTQGGGSAGHPAGGWGSPLQPTPTSAPPQIVPWWQLSVDAALAQILRIGFGVVGGILFNPAQAGGRAEIQWEIENAKKQQWKAGKVNQGWVQPRKVTDDLRHECEAYAHARSDKYGHPRYGRQWMTDYEKCIRWGGIENIP